MFNQAFASPDFSEFRVRGFSHSGGCHIGKVLLLSVLLRFSVSQSLRHPLLCFFAFLLLCPFAAVHAQVTWGPDVRLTYAPGSALGPELAVWKDTLYVVWWDTRPIGGNNAREIYFKRSTNGGGTWSPDLKLSLADSSAVGPDIASRHDTVHVVWTDYRRLGYSIIYYRRSTDAGVTWGSETPLSPLNGNVNYPTIVLGDSQEVYVVWMVLEGIRFRKSLDGGATWLRDTLIADTTRAGSASSMAYAQGVLHIVNEVWLNATEVVYFRSTDKGTTWQFYPPLSATDSIHSFRPRLAVGSIGRVHVCWTDYKYSPYIWTGDVFYRRSPNHGITWEPVQEWVGPHRVWGGGDITSDGDKVFVTWEDERAAPNQNSEIYSRMSTDGGITWSSDERLTYAPGSSSGPRIAAWDSLVHLIWTDVRDDTANDVTELYYKRGVFRVGVEQGWSEGARAEGSGFEIRPNPMRGCCVFRYRSGLGANFRLTIYDLTGRTVRSFSTSASRLMPYDVFWDGRDEKGRKAEPGVYIVSMAVGNRTEMKKIVLLR